MFPFILKFTAYFVIFLFTLFNCQPAISSIIHDNYTLDVYQSKQITAQQIDKMFGADLKQIAAMMISLNAFPTPKNSKDLMSKMGKLLGEIHKLGDFAYLSVSPVMYPGIKRISFSIDVVDKDAEKRMRDFLPKPQKMLDDPNHLIENWQAYEKDAFNYMIRHKIGKPYQHCPAFHCIFGFEQPGLKHYGEKFSREVPRFKKQLISILRNDRREQNRGAAAYLLAHLKDPNEIVEALSPSIRDSHSSVRNNVMRVLAGTAASAKVNRFPIDAAIKALSYPAESDRNKALYMLLSITTMPKYAAYVREHGCYDVVAQFHMAQPNLHDMAHNVLKNISGKNYPANDISAWDNWASENCSHPTSI